MNVHFSTRRQDLTAFIEMTEAGLAWQRENEDGAQDAKMVEKLAEWKDELAQLGGPDHSGPRVHEQVEAPRTLTDRPAAGSSASNQYGEFSVHYATEPQTRFIRSLMERKDLSPLADSVTIDVARLREQVAAQQVNKKAASAIIERLLALPDLATAAPRPAVRPASEKQVALITRLAAEKDWTDLDGDGGQNVATVTAVLAGETVGIKDASSAIDMLFGAPRKAAPAAARTIEAGVYVNTDGSTFRVYFGQQSGRMLAARVVDGDFEYAGQADRFVKADARKMTAEEAGAWGKTTGRCVFCARKLDVPSSVDRGIGPDCFAKFC